MLALQSCIVHYFINRLYSVMLFTLIQFFHHSWGKIFAPNFKVQT